MHKILISCILLPIFNCELQAQDAVQTIEAEPGISKWIMQESTGRIFASSTRNDQVIEYDADGSKVREFEVGGEPTEMLIKGSKLIVGCRKSTSMYVIDLDKNKVVGSAKLAGQGPYALFLFQS